MKDARSVRVRGVVQGVGFRPFVYRTAVDHAIDGWVLNDGDGVMIHVEGDAGAVRSFLEHLPTRAPTAAAIEDVEVRSTMPLGLRGFRIRASLGAHEPTARIPSDLPTCERCLREFSDPTDPRYGYLYINCTDCGPRYSIIEGLPYDRDRTVMRGWDMDELCRREYHDPTSRRFHAQPVACPECGPKHQFLHGNRQIEGDAAAVRAAADALAHGSILAIKGVGGYHLSCDATNPAAVREIRYRKFRKEKPFALMARDLTTAASVVAIDAEARRLMSGTARPIVICPALVELAGVSPDNETLGVMLPYTALHHALFRAGAPGLLVMTSANRSSEPIAYEDADARERLSGLADGFLIGERPIARRVDDSVVRATPEGPAMVRRSRGFAPDVVSRLPTGRLLLGLGGDLKNTVTLVVGGKAIISQHIGDLEHYDALRAFRATITDLIDMYRVDREALTIVADRHPQYRSTQHAPDIGAPETLFVQHHRAHVASVIAEREAWRTPVVGLALDGTGYGEDGSIWGGEFFSGSLERGLDRVAGLRSFLQVGGDAAARSPVQAAVGILDQLAGPFDVTAPPFGFGDRYRSARQVAGSSVRTFESRSTGRLFDAAAALVGFLGENTFEGQAAIWLEQLASRCAIPVEPYPCPFAAAELDFRPLVQRLVEDRVGGRDVREIARAFHTGLAAGLVRAARELADRDGSRVVAISGGVFQNALLTHEVARGLRASGLEPWMNRMVPPNDGGVSLGQVALAAFSPGAAGGTLGWG